MSSAAMSKMALDIFFVVMYYISVRVKTRRRTAMSRICVTEKEILIDGKKTKIASGAMHYFRIHPEHWRDRLLKLAECGCNTVETYLVWNLHEAKEGSFDFSGWLDFGKFLDIAKEMGLYAIVRPGPYICSEWEFGGLPWWLLKYPDMELRCMNPLFIEKITPFLKRAAEILRPRMIDNGGNVIFVQIENEYGSYGNDKEYLRFYKDFYISEGINCPLITSDGETEFLLHNGTLPDVMASVNYRWDSVRCLASLQKYHGGQPGAVMELWNGKAQHWGEPIIKRDIPEVASSVKLALENAELVNLYMFHGGTTFGFMNGTLDFGEKLLVQMTSYDVDAPLDEYGRRTEKYYAEQKVICEALGKKIENTAKDTVIRDYGEATPVGVSRVDASLVRKTRRNLPVSMEACDQGYGYIIYETNVFVGECGAKIFLSEIHDIAQVYVDGAFVKTIEKHTEDKTFEIKERGDHKISVLVENMGRINYGVNLKTRKGLIGDIMLFDLEYDVRTKPMGYDIYSLELDKLPESYSDKAEPNAPAFYKFEFYADKAEDTVLRLEGFTRGVAFINGFNLGRHWDIENSPNKLFIPAPLVKEGKNEIVVFDVLAKDTNKKLRLSE